MIFGTTGKVYQIIDNFIVPREDRNQLDDKHTDCDLLFGEAAFLVLGRGRSLGEFIIAMDIKAACEDRGWKRAVGRGLTLPFSHCQGHSPAKGSTFALTQPSFEQLLSEAPAATSALCSLRPWCCRSGTTAALLPFTQALEGAGQRARQIKEVI